MNNLHDIRKANFELTAMRRNKIFMTLLLTVLISAAGCKKFTDVQAPTTSLTGANVYASDATAIAVLTGIYANWSGSDPGATLGSIPSLTLYAGLSADELTLYSGNSDQTATAYYTNALTGAPTNYGVAHWSILYSYIFQCNDAIVGLNASNSLTPVVKKQLLGEAKFIRAFCYFYLVNLYGDVPLALTPDPKVNNALSRAPTAQVYAQIIADLRAAQKLLSPNFLDGTLLKTSQDRVRPSSWSATALLARAYLYNKNWAGADSAATTVINNSDNFNLSNLNNTFLRASLGNKEAIWQLQPVTSGDVTNTLDASVFLISSAGPMQAGDFGAYVSSNLLASFEPGDGRLTSWIDTITVSGTTYYFPFKYKVGPNNPNYPLSPPVTEHLMMLRLGEQYLIRAEARARQNNVGGAQLDLNAIRNRAGLANTVASDGPNLLTAILHEREVEFFAELGQRWLDLKRTGAVDSVMSIVTPQKGGAWRVYQQLYPIPSSDIQSDPKLVQNNGY